MKARGRGRRICCEASSSVMRFLAVGNGGGGELWRMGGDIKTGEMGKVEAWRRVGDVLERLADVANGRGRVSRRGPGGLGRVAGVQVPT